METIVNNNSVNCTIEILIKTVYYEYWHCMLPDFWR